MKKHIAVPIVEDVIMLTSKIVYKQDTAWCGFGSRPLHLSLLRPKSREKHPLIVFFCGGAFTAVDPDIWIPELVCFAKHGYAVASVEYSVTARTLFPDQLEDAKAAIRFLRAHAVELNIDAEKIVVMGESAGAYIAELVAMTGDHREYDRGDNPEYSSEVNGAVALYFGELFPQFPVHPGVAEEMYKRMHFPMVKEFVRESLPPFLLLHGTEDQRVYIERSDYLYEQLQAKNVPVEYYILDGASHASAHFSQPEVKQIILSFCDGILKNDR